MGIEEQFGEIVIAPRVLEKIIAIATAKVDGVHSFSNKSVSDTLSKLSLGRGVYLKESNEELTADIYLYLEYGVKVPKVALAIQKAVKDAVHDMADVEIQFYGTEVIGVTVPTTVELTVAETQPSIKGATVTGSGKPATMETGLVVNVPDFIEAGQKLIINTAEGTYVSRA